MTNALAYYNSPCNKVKKGFYCAIPLRSLDNCKNEVAIIKKT